jgi:hypothetical protein
MSALTSTDLADRRRAVQVVGIGATALLAAGMLGFLALYWAQDLPVARELYAAFRAMGRGVDAALGTNVFRHPFMWQSLSTGVLVGVSIIMFVFAWNQYLWPLIIIDSQANQVAQVGLALLEGDVQSGELAWALVMAGSMLTLLPPLLLMIVFRKPLLNTFSIQQK